jgi:hypothetical protein
MKVVDTDCPPYEMKTVESLIIVVATPQVVKLSSCDDSAPQCLTDCLDLQPVHPRLMRRKSNENDREGFLQD